MSSGSGNRVPSMLATLLISHHELPKKWLKKTLAQLPGKVDLQVFFVDSGTLLVGKKLAGQHFVNQVYCSYSHRILSGPKPLAGINSGGLLNLGEMISQSEYTISIPRSIPPVKPVRSRLKEIGLILDSDSRRGIDGLRVATGLAGCNHRLTLFFPHDGFPFISGAPQVPGMARPYLEALTSLGARFSASPVSYDRSEYDLLLSL
jgi:hypothetical protein